MMSIHSSIKYCFGIVSAMLLVACSSPAAQQHVDAIRDTIQAERRLAQPDLLITLEDSILKYGDEIYLNFSLQNNTNELQRVLLDKPVLCTRGPWNTTVDITNVNTGISLVKYQNKSLLCSQIYAQSELEKYYHVLHPGESISGKYNLNNLVVLEGGDNLPPGVYDMIVWCSGNSSNTIRFSVE